MKDKRKNQTKNMKNDGTFLEISTYLLFGNFRISLQ